MVLVTMKWPPSKGEEMKKWTSLTSQKEECQGHIAVEVLTKVTLHHGGPMVPSGERTQMSFTYARNLAQGPGVELQPLLAASP